MVACSLNVGVDKLAIAEEVITSACNILMTAGFETTEIESLLRHAADQMASGDAVPIQAGEESVQRVHSLDADGIRSEFEELPPIESLRKLKMRAEAGGKPNDGREQLGPRLITTT